MSSSYNNISSTKNILYLSYDGMTDPLGQSQVLPYIVGLSGKGYNFTLVSCEKPERFKSNRAIIEKICKEHNIDWQPIPFTTKPPILAKYYDIYKMEQKAIGLHKEKKFTMVHCRSYISAAIGERMKKRFGVKYFFDMRGFWVDERVDGGMWDRKNPFFDLAYKYYKKQEGKYIANADMIVSLTEAGKQEIKRWGSYQQAPIGVIPCSADFQLFSLITADRKASARELLGFSEETLVISYLGSIGTWYMLDEMLEVYALIKKKYSNAKFLFITPEPPEMVYDEARKHGLEKDDFVIRFAKRDEVPVFAAASDINLFFIKQSYSKIASSPTKLGEILALGIPVICNSKVGDVKEIVEFTNSGIAIDEFDASSYERIVEYIPELLKKDPATIRQNATEYYQLDNAIEKYYQLYKKVLK
ncbi:glycosyltransferase [Rufibacter roseolus]|uniref:glycosyltransferase n=1 Tax=Rufibacter roseolus TaxID=2817375 RepID=UPI001B30A052|nr:glycosyltransferase [Rufibacter roseolus]